MGTRHRGWKFRECGSKPEQYALRDAIWADAGAKPPSPPPCRSCFRRSGHATPTASKRGKARGSYDRVKAIFKNVIARGRQSFARPRAREREKKPRIRRGKGSAGVLDFVRRYSSLRPPQRQVSKATWPHSISPPSCL